MVALLALALAGCGGGGGSSSTPSQSDSPSPSQYSIGGTVTGLTGSGLVLQDNGGNNLAISSNGSFTFTTQVSAGSSYAVTVTTQPSNPAQTCTVSNGSGTASANVTSVAVSCSSAGSTVTIGGTVSRLAGAGLVLQDNGGDNLTVTGNGSFTFKTALAAGTQYSVTVATQPSSPSQYCVVTNGTGTTVSANVTSVMVMCSEFAYTASNTGGTIYAYTIDPSTGALTQVSGSPYADGTSPAAVSLAPNGLFAFSASNNGTEIQAFTINQSTGQLTEVAGSPFGTGFVQGSSYPDIAVDAQSAHLYLASANDAEVAGFAINQTTGALTALPGSPYAAGQQAGGIPAFSPDGNSLYVVDQTSTGGVSGYAIDPTTGALTAISGSPFPTEGDPTWIAFTPSGSFAYVANTSSNTISAYSVDPTTGALTPLSPTSSFPTDEAPADLTIDSTGTHLYVPMAASPTTAAGEVDVFTINSDGTLTQVTGSPYPVGVGPKFLNIDPSGQFAYVASAGSGGTGVYGFSIDSTTGALTALAGSPFATGSEPQFITIDPSGRFGYTADQGSGTISAFSINQSTGVLTAITGSPFATGGSPFFVSISPEASGIRD